MATTKKVTKKAAAKKAPAKKAAAKKAGPVRVTVARDGFRRLGRAWHGTTELPAGELGSDELAVLQADPMFTVEG